MLVPSAGRKRWKRSASKWPKAGWTGRRRWRLCRRRSSSSVIQGSPRRPLPVTPARRQKSLRQQTSPRRPASRRGRPTLALFLPVPLRPREHNAHKRACLPRPKAARRSEPGLGIPGRLARHRAQPLRSPAQTVPGLAAPPKRPGRRPARAMRPSACAGRLPRPGKRVNLRQTRAAQAGPRPPPPAHGKRVRHWKMRAANLPGLFRQGRARLPPNPPRPAILHPRPPRLRRAARPRRGREANLRGHRPPLRAGKPGRASRAATLIREAGGRAGALPTGSPPARTKPLQAVRRDHPGPGGGRACGQVPVPCRVAVAGACPGAGYLSGRAGQSRRSGHEQPQTIRPARGPCRAQPRALRAGPAALP